MNGNYILGHAAFFPYRIPVGPKAVVKRRKLVKGKRVVKGKRRQKRL